MRPAVFLLGLLVASCGGGQTRGTPFEPDWPEDHGASMATFVASFRGARVPRGADVAVGVADHKALLGAPLDGGPPWTYPHAIHGRPALTGSVVVGAGAGELFALEARTGKLLWTRPSGGRIRGVGDDGRTTVISLIPTTGFGSTVLAVSRDGNIVRQLEDDDVAIGVPAVVGDSVFFPWSGRFLSVYDLTSGAERARVDLHVRVSHVIAIGGVLFAGERSLTRLDEHIADAGTRGAARVDLPPPLGGRIPGDPAWMRPGTDWLTHEADDRDKIRLYARPTTRGQAATSGGRFAGTFHQVALGFDARGGALAWAHAHDTEFLGGAAYEGGFALCDAAGTVTFFDGASGAVGGTVALGKPVESCQVQADAVVRPERRGPIPKLVDQVDAVLRLRAPELAPVQRALRDVGPAAGVGNTPPS